MSAREGTCIEHERRNATVAGKPLGFQYDLQVAQWWARCAHGYEWRLGHTREDSCAECVLARCNHPKAGIPVEQQRLV